MRWRAAAALALVACLAGVGAQGAAATRHHHGRCGRFCRHAGGLGGSPGEAPCKILTRRIHAHNGIATVRVRCTGGSTSRGALVIWPHNTFKDYVDDGVPKGSYDGVDLVVPSGKTRTFHILLSPKARALLARRGKLRVDVLVELKTKPVEVVERFKVPLTGS